MTKVTGRRFSDTLGLVKKNGLEIAGWKVSENRPRVTCNYNILIFNQKYISPYNTSRGK